MRQFLRQSTLMATLCFLVLGFFEIPIQLNYSKRTYWQDDWNELASDYRDVLLIGNSRAWTGFDAPHLSECTSKNCYTVALDGWNAQFLSEKCKYYLKHQQPPTHIIVQLDPSMTFERVGWHGKDKLLKHLFLDRLGIFPFSSTLRGHRDLDFLLPGFRYFGNHQAYFRDISITTNRPNPVHSFDSLRRGFNPYRPDTIPFPPLPNSTIWNNEQTMPMLARISDLGALFPDAQVLFIYPPISSELQQVSHTGPFENYARSQDAPFMNFSYKFDDTVMHDHTHCTNIITEIIADSICSWVQTQ